MHKKILFALLLVLNHSLMFGAIEAAAIPNKDHPYGQAIPHEHLHPHDHHEVYELSHSHSHDDGYQQTISTATDDDQHDHHHSHGLNIQLNCDLPYSLSFNLQVSACDAPTDYQITHQSLTYAPPVPPPNH